jgi:hypothetical protein
VVLVVDILVKDIITGLVVVMVQVTLQHMVVTILAMVVAGVLLVVDMQTV